MANVQDVKMLRQMSGLSMIRCKEALDETGGDFQKAKEVLRKQGAKITEKKASRQTSAGIVDSYIHAGGKKGSLVQLLCETDFVARNEKFKELAHDIAMQIVVVDPANEAELLASLFIKDESKSIKDRIDDAVSLLGENIKLGKFYIIEL